MKLLEAQASHRQEQEAHLVKAQTALPVRGQIIGTILCLFFGAIGWHLSLNQHDAVAGLLFSTTILGLITVFVLGRVPRQASAVAQRAKAGKQK